MPRLPRLSGQDAIRCSLGPGLFYLHVRFPGLVVAHVPQALLTC